MSSSKRFLCGFCSFVLVCTSAQTASSEPPVLGAMLAETSANEAIQQKLRAQYVYREHFERRSLDQRNNPGKIEFTADREVIYLEGHTYKKLVQVDGKPLTKSKARAEQARMEKTAAERRAEADKGRRRAVKIDHGRLKDVLRLMETSFAGEQSVGGRETWVVKANPSDQGILASPADSRVLCYRHTYWIDRQDKVVARHEYEVICDRLDVNPGTKITVVFGKEDETLWLPRSSAIQLNGKDRKTGHKLFQYEYTDYQKFEAQSTIQFEPEQ